MKREGINYLVVGGFVLLMLLILLAVLLRITGKTAGRTDYFVELEQVAGIAAGTPVTYGGYRIGHVGGIEPRRREGGTVYRVRLAVQPDWHIPRDSTAGIVQPQLLGGYQIDIREGRSTEPLPPGGTLAAAPPAMIMTAVNRLATGLAPLAQRLDGMLARVDTEVIARLPALLEDARRLVHRLDRTAERLGRFASTDNLRRAEATLAHAEDMSRRLAAAAERLEHLAGEAGGLVSENRPDVRQTVVELRQSAGILSRHLEGLMENLDSASRRLDEFARRVRDDPALLLRGSEAPAEPPP